MQTLTIRADEALISQIVAISKALANTTNQKLIIDEDYPIYDDSKTMKQRIADYEADIEAIRRGELETYPLEGIRDEIAKW